MSDANLDKSGMLDVVMIYATCPASDVAEAIGATLIELGLAACVNILPGMTSLYVWEGKLNRDSEVAAVIKTRADLADRAIAEAKALHPYDNPAFVVLPIVGGSVEFLAWITAQTTAKA